MEQEIYERMAAEEEPIYLFIADLAVYLPSIADWDMIWSDRTTLTVPDYIATQAWMVQVSCERIASGDLEMYSLSISMHQMTVDERYTADMPALRSSSFGAGASWGLMNSADSGDFGNLSGCDLLDSAERGRICAEDEDSEESERNVTLM